MKRKVNPRRRPATQADVNRAKNAATEYAVKTAQAIFLTVLLDKENASKEDIKRVWSEINDLSDSVTLGYANIPDLQKVLEEEYEIII